MMEEGLRDTVLITTYHICERCKTAIVKESNRSNNVVRKCNKCGTADRYNNGACKYCASVRQKERYRNSLDEVSYKNAIARDEDRQLRRVAMSSGRVLYVSIMPCKVCGANVRYARSNQCRKCVEVKALKRKGMLDGDVN